MTLTLKVILMESYKPGGNKTNIWVWIITAFFLIVGIAFIIIANFSNVVSWLRVFGITLIVCCAPIVAWLIYQIAKYKINKM